MSKHSGKPAEGIVTSDAVSQEMHGRHLPKLNVKLTRKKLFIIGAVIVVLAVVVLVFVATRKQPQFVPQTSIPASQLDSIPANYEEMTIPEAEYRIQVDTGRSVADLESKPINKKLLGNFDKAYAAARGLCRLGKMSRCSDAYALAATMAPAGAYNFYMTYAYQQYSFGSKQTAVMAAQKAKTAVQIGTTDSSVRRVISTNANAIIQSQKGSS